MLFPAVSILTAQDHQLPLLSSKSGEVRDLHNHGPDTAMQSTQCTQDNQPQHKHLSTFCCKVTWNSAHSRGRGTVDDPPEPTTNRQWHCDTPPQGHWSSSTCFYVKPNGISLWVHVAFWNVSFDKCRCCTFNQKKCTCMSTMYANLLKNMFYRCKMTT